MSINESHLVPIASAPIFQSKEEEQDSLTCDKAQPAAQAAVGTPAQWMHLNATESEYWPDSLVVSAALLHPHESTARAGQGSKCSLATARALLTVVTDSNVYASILCELTSR